MKMKWNIKKELVIGNGRIRKKREVHRAEDGRKGR